MILLSIATDESLYKSTLNAIAPHTDDRNLNLLSQTLKLKFYLLEGNFSKLASDLHRC